MVILFLVSSDIDECEMRKLDPKYEELYPCRKGVCQNTPGSYICKCKKGKKSDGTGYGCQPADSPDYRMVVGERRVYNSSPLFHLHK